jgi:tetratricopeptide (TPR) repeat protein
MKNAILLFLLTFIFFSTEAQKKRKKDKEPSLEQIDKMLSQQLDSDVFLANAAKRSCLCIDSIDIINKNHKELSTAISVCIDKEATVYQMSSKLFSSMFNSGKNNKIEINQNKESAEYRRYYYDIERWLNDSCSALKKTASSNNKISAFSFSDNGDAINAYNEGIEKLKTDSFKDALPWFEKAVKQDEKFAFAWDNIGVCKRKLGDLDGALEAYTKSLQLDPKGKLPLQNIPVVYEFKKEYDKALEAYKNLSKIYPDDPEAYYGAGRMYELKGDIEKALDNMCKAYTAYVEINSPYRVDAENNINIYYKKMKAAGKEELFYKILKENNLNPATK